MTLQAMIAPIRVNLHTISQFNPLCCVHECTRVLCMQLLELSALCLRCEVGRLLCDSRCWEIFQTCHKITCQERVSSLLGNTAGNTLAHIVLMVFSRARQPRTVAAQHVSPSASKSKHKAITATTAATTGSTAAAATAAATAVDSNSSNANIQQQQQSVHSSAHTEHSASTTTARLHTGNDSDSSSSSSRADECVLVDGVDTGDDGGDEYTEQFHKEQLSKDQLKSHRRRRRRTNRDHSAATGNGDSTNSSATLNALVEIMRFLSRLSNPRENSEETCILSLSLINIALEAGGVQLGQHKALVEVHKQQLFLLVIV
jgi:hypothetical protein